MTCDTNCPYRTLNRCTVTGRDVRDLERCPPGLGAHKGGRRLCGTDCACVAGSAPGAIEQS